MGWMETDVMSQRVRFIAAWLNEEESVTALALRFGVSRKTAHKWIARYREEGAAGLHDRSSAPHTQAFRISPELPLGSPSSAANIRLGDHASCELR